MGRLLSSAIKMQGGASATATLILQLVDATSMAWTKNGVFQGNVFGTETYTINAGDTFSATSTDAMGTSLEYYLNGVFTNAYFSIPTATSPTFTASAGNEYKFMAFTGA